MDISWYPLIAVVCSGALFLTKRYTSGTQYYGQERVDGKTVVITGANTGIGKETAKELARRGARVIMACRDMKKAEVAQLEIISETSNKNVLSQYCDLASFASIRDFAANIIKTEPRVDMLINNAGIMICPKLLTEDGFEMQLGVNHLGHFLLTHLLLDKLKQSAPSRIIVLSSLAHTRGTINFDDLNSEKSYSRINAYAQSKLANVLFVKELAKQLAGTSVTVYAVHPGIVHTDLIRHATFGLNWLKKIYMAVTWIVHKSAVEGSQTTLYCALSSDIDHMSGKYFSDCHVKEPSKAGQDASVAKQLWEISEKWTGISSEQ